MRTAIPALLTTFLLAWSAPAIAQTEPVVAEAQAFMAAYGQDLAKGDRAAIADRYDKTGAYFLVAGGHEFSTHAQIVADYAGSWQAPASFEWRDLHFDAAGPDGVVVNGQFLWGTPKGSVAFTYTGFLRRQDGKLRIRLEDETPAAAAK